jgi:hypothetical protein
MVALAPAARLPVQVRFGLVNDAVPTVAVMPVGPVASSSTSVRLSVKVAPLMATVPVLVTVTV